MSPTEERFGKLILAFVAETGCEPTEMLVILNRMALSYAMVLERRKTRAKSKEN